MGELKTELKKWYKQPWVIMLGVLLSPIIILLSPFLILLVWKKKNWFKWIKISLTVIPVLWGIFLVIGVSANINENKERVRQAEEYLQEAHNAIAANDMVKARVNLEESIKKNSSKENMAHGILKEIDYLTSERYIEEVVKEMTYDEFHLLKTDKLRKSYMSNEILNSMFIDKLKEEIPVIEEMMAILEEERKAEQLRKEAEEEEARIQKEKEERKKQIESAFSAWDGSHKNLTKVIKEVMHDPDSYKHVETVYWDMGDYLVVRTTFRGTNAFGGTVTESIKAEADLDGNILKILDE